MTTTNDNGGGQLIRTEHDLNALIDALDQYVSNTEEIEDELSTQQTAELEAARVMLDRLQSTRIRLALGEL